MRGATHTLHYIMQIMKRIIRKSWRNICKKTLKKKQYDVTLHCYSLICHFSSV